MFDVLDEINYQSYNDFVLRVGTWLWAAATRASTLHPPHPGLGDARPHLRQGPRSKGGASRGRPGDKGTLYPKGHRPALETPLRPHAAGGKCPQRWF